MNLEISLKIFYIVGGMILLVGAIAVYFINKNKNKS